MGWNQGTNGLSILWAPLGYRGLHWGTVGSGGEGRASPSLAPTYPCLFLPTPITFFPFSSPFPMYSSAPVLLFNLRSYSVHLV